MPAIPVGSRCCPVQLRPPQVTWVVIGAVIIAHDREVRGCIASAAQRRHESEDLAERDAAHEDARRRRLWLRNGGDAVVFGGASAPGL
jgi:hypothetical protein